MSDYDDFYYNNYYDPIDDNPLFEGRDDEDLYDAYLMGDPDVIRAVIEGDWEIPDHLRDREDFFLKRSSDGCCRFVRRKSPDGLFISATPLPHVRGEGILEVERNIHRYQKPDKLDEKKVIRQKERYYRKLAHQTKKPETGA